VNLNEIDGAYPMQELRETLTEALSRIQHIMVRL